MVCVAPGALRPAHIFIIFTERHVWTHSVVGNAVPQEPPGRSASRKEVTAEPRPRKGDWDGPLQTKRDLGGAAADLKETWSWDGLPGREDENTPTPMKVGRNWGISNKTDFSQ